MSVSLQLINSNAKHLHNASNHQIKRVEINKEHQNTSLFFSTLDINELLQLFYSQISTLFSIDQLIFTSENPKLRIRLGEPAIHRCTYSLKYNTEVLGHLNIARTKRFTDDELNTFENLLGALILPLRNALKYSIAIKLAEIDQLTQLKNKFTFENDINREIKRAARNEELLACLMIDIDNFKVINDTYGHSLGDHILKLVSQTIQAAARETDYIYRWGGEEFSLLINSKTGAGPVAIAERVRLAVSQIKKSNLNIHQEITVSIGIAIFEIDEDPDTLVDRADKAMYQAKNTGKNKVCCA